MVARSTTADDDGERVQSRVKQSERAHVEANLNFGTDGDAA